MIIDRYMPAFDLRHYHETRVDADSSVAYTALRALDLEESWLVRLLFAIRSLPSREGSRRSTLGMRSFIDSALAIGWRILEEDPGHELVIGAVTKPWAIPKPWQTSRATSFLVSRPAAMTWFTMSLIWKVKYWNPTP
jgi:hypothetical protein